MESLQERSAEDNLEGGVASPTRELAEVVSEMTSVAETVDSTISNFANLVEENKAEIDVSLKRIENFVGTVARFSEIAEQLSIFVTTFSKFTSQVRDIADKITVLSINSSVEISKGQIDRDALRKISEMIMKLAGDVRKLSRDSEAYLKNVRKTFEEINSSIQDSLRNLGEVNLSLSNIASLNDETAKNLGILMEVARIARNVSLKLSDTMNKLKEMVSYVKSQLELLE